MGLAHISNKKVLCHAMIKPIAFQNKSARGLMPAIFAAVGFLAGAAVYACFNRSISGIPAPDLTSAFDTDSPFFSLISCFESELRYILIISLLGFCFFGEIAGLITLSIKAALTGFSATYILAGTYSLDIYLIHTLSSLGVLVFLCCTCRISGDFSVKYICEKNHLSHKEILNYLAKCLFYCGDVFFIQLLRHILLALI